MTKRNAKRSEGLDRGGKAREKAGKAASSLLNRRPSPRVRAESLRKSAEEQRITAAYRRALLGERAPVESPLSGGDIFAPSAMVSRIARISSGFVVRATFYGPDCVRHEVEASAATFAGVLAELARAVASTLEAA